MIKNYLKIALRNILKRRVFTFINIMGLSIGMAASLMIVSYVIHELSYDSFHKKGDRIHRVHFTYQAENGVNEVAKVPFPIKPILLERYPEIADVTRLYSNTALNNIPIIQYEDKQFSEEGFYFADPNVFDVFEFNLIKGNPKNALMKPESVVITEKMAAKYFGNDDPMGKVLRYQNRADLTVTGVMENIPQNSHIRFDMLAPVSYQRYEWKGHEANNGYDFEQDWDWAGAWVYLVLKADANAHILEEKIQAVAKEFLNDPGEDKHALALEKLSDIHLHSNADRGMGSTGSITQIYGFVGIAVLLLVIAGINFMNLATAQSAQRAKEVGLRKVMGANRGGLIFQFLGESLLIVLCATIVAGLLTELFMPSFNQLTGKMLNIQYFENPAWIAAIIGGAIFLSIAAGSYPAFFLSRFQPAKTLKGGLDKETNGTFSIRKVLVIVQFCLSTLLIIGILIIKEQLDFIRNKELGFDKEQIIVLKNGNQLNDSYRVFKKELLLDSRVKGVTQGNVPGKSNWTQSFSIPGKDGTTRMGIKHVDNQFVSMYNLDLVSGRDFTASKADSTEAVMLNEAAAKLLGLSNDQALGQTMSFIGGPDNRTVFNIKVIGVLKDAHFTSLHRKINPEVFKLSYWGDVAIKLDLEDFSDYQEAISFVSNTWSKVLPDWPFEYSFLDEDIDALYANERKLSTAIGFAAFLAIIIACLGLFGLVLFTIEQRTKEIGIRKVLGATEAAILKMVSSYFVKIVLMASALAIPIGYLGGKFWLENFAYRIDLGWSIFMNAALASIAIAIVTVGYHSIKAARQNPVETLKEE